MSLKHLKINILFASLQERSEGSYSTVGAIYKEERAIDSCSPGSTSLAAREQS